MSVYGREFMDATGIFHAEISVSACEPPYPAMVVVEWESGSLLSDDARELAKILTAAAAAADMDSRGVA